MEESGSQSSLKESSDAKEFKGFDGRLGSESGGKTNVTNVHASFSPPAHYNPASGFGMGIGPGMGPGTGFGMGMGPGMGPGTGFGMGMGPGIGPGTGFGMGLGMEPGIGTGMGTGNGPDIGEDPSVFGGDQAPALDQEALNQAMMAALNARFRRFVGISANLTAQWKNDNILGQFEVSFIFVLGFKLNQWSLTSFK